MFALVVPFQLSLSTLHNKKKKRKKKKPNILDFLK